MSSVIDMKPTPTRPSSDSPVPPPAPGLDRSVLVRAVELQGQHKTAEAEQLFRMYLGVYPDDPIAVYSLCVILLQRRDIKQALALLDHGTRAAPDFAPLWAARASAQQALGLKDEALKSYDQALTIKPDFVEVLVNSGALLREMHQHAAALERFNRVLQINPNYETALGNCAILLTEFKRSEQAIAMFERLLAINPKYDYGLGLLAYERLHICDWRDFDDTARRIDEGVQAGRPTCKSLGYMAISDSAADHQTCARTFAKRFLPSSEPLWTGERYRHKKIRLAYVSPDLREHPVGHLMAAIFEKHDKNRFETIAISLGPNDSSRLRERMLNSFDHFIDARQMGSRQIAELMRKMEVDVAVDLAGYTSDSRTEVFAHRPAPAHINYLGYPGTMGVDYMDYIIADRHVIPPEHQQFYDEKVIYLPDSYLPTAGGIQIAERTPTRAECGLPEQGVVFCSFNHDYKISPHVFAVWMRLLLKTPGSVLWLMSRNEVSQRNLRASAQAAGVDPQRLIFANRVPRVEDHLARYRQADIFLDTHPYNAHTTAADALMSGLPVVTYMGGAFPARVAGSLLHTVGLRDLITHTLDDYEAVALRLAQHPAELAEVKSRLARNRAVAPLFDSEEICRHLESIYTSVWHQTQLDSRPPLADALTAQAEDFSVDGAEADLQRGNLQKAEMLCRQKLEQEPQHRGALKLLGDIASCVGAHDFAAKYYATALATLPDTPARASSLNGLVQQAQTQAPAAQALTQPAADKFLLIKAWGFGFWSDLDHVAGELLLAELTGRTPIIHWGSNSLFRDADTDNAFTSFFQPVSSHTLADLEHDGLSFYPPKWTAKNLRQEDLHKWDGDGARLSGLYALRRPDNVVVSDFHTKVNDLIPWIPQGHPLHGLDRNKLYRHLFTKYLRLQPHLQAHIDQQAQATLAGRHWLAVHVRGSDKVREMSHLEAVNQAYWSSIDQILMVNPVLNIFLLTDSEQVVTQFKARYGDKVLTLDAQRSSDQTGVHYAGHSGTVLGEQVILDAWLAARCDFFLGNGGSNVSVGIRHLKDWQPGTFFLIGPDFLGERNLTLHNW